MTKDFPAQGNPIALIARILKAKYFMYFLTKYKQ